MPEDELEDSDVTKKLKALPRWCKVIQKAISDGTPGVWTHVCTFPSDVHHWRMYSFKLTDGTATESIQISHDSEPAPDGWYPLFPRVESHTRYSAPKHLYARPWTGGIETILVVEIWTTKMPAAVGEKEKSMLKKPGRRQV